MSPTLIAAVVTILAAATIYTVAVFAEYRARRLKNWHIALFWSGLVFDTIGTTLMSEIAGGFKPNVHGILGILAIVLMLVHAGWATTVRLLKQERFLRNFHHFSLSVWTLWMISLVTGFALAIPNMAG
jgi:uncharacterized repeat protein (TIGR03987 family)